MLELTPLIRARNERMEILADACDNCCVLSDLLAGATVVDRVSTREALMLAELTASMLKTVRESLA